MSVGAYSLIGPNVTIGDGVKLHSHVVIDGYTFLGAGCGISIHHAGRRATAYAL